MRRSEYQINRVAYQLKRLFLGVKRAEQAVEVSQIHDFWREPPKCNEPEKYAKDLERTKGLEDSINNYAQGMESAIEIGCNVGRNLDALRRLGVARLAGVEISSDAVAAMRKHFPGLAETVEIHNAPAEEVLPRLEDNGFDLVYTMAVLLHIHPDSEWIFAEMARICRKRLITVEYEGAPSYRIYSRNYKVVFESHGLREIWAGPSIGLPKYTTRVFEKPDGEP
jgi:SAM-dependent methyltransferase